MFFKYILTLIMNGKEQQGTSSDKCKHLLLQTICSEKKKNRKELNNKVKIQTETYTSSFPVYLYFFLFS